MQRMTSDERQYNPNTEAYWRARREERQSAALARRARRRKHVGGYLLFLLVLFTVLYLTGHVLVSLFAS